MSGGITQLVAIGAQDSHLVGNPEVSFFRSVYRRHTNFSHVVDRQILIGNPSAGGISTVRFERKGDMLGYVYLTLNNGGTSNLIAGENEIEKVEFLIGGQVIDTQTSDFSVNVGDPLLVSSVTKSVSTPANFYPLHFWFCENYQSAIPLVALQYHDVEIRVTWKSPATTGTYECWADYIYLDEAERAEIASKPVNMLITQTQQSVVQAGPQHELNFNHPIKFLAAGENLVSSPTDTTLQIQVNGVQIGEPRLYTPHYNETPLYYHCPFFGTDVAGQSFFLHSFCLDTNKFQPTGSLNFSRLDSVRLMASSLGLTGSMNIYGVNYNILRIENGMGGLMYAN